VAVVQYYGTGRRKTSTARVFLRPGNGAIVVNQQPVEQSFPTASVRAAIRQPLLLTEMGDKFDVLATSAGGGVSGQAGALRLGIARALCQYNLELRPTLKRAGLLTRDPRVKERKKYGLAGARKRFSANANDWRAARVARPTAIPDGVRQLVMEDA
jgi:small subunit ribosomal protein S9